MDKEQLIEMWKKEFYEKYDLQEFEDEDFHSLAVGFFIAKGATPEEAGDTYSICVQRGILTMPDRDYEHFPKEMFGPGDWQPTSELRWVEIGAPPIRILQQRWQRFVWEDDAHLADRPSGNYEHEWRNVPCE